MVCDLLDNSANRDTVYVDIENGHENADLYGWFAQRVINILKTLHLQYPAIGRCQHRLGLFATVTLGVPEKKDDKKADNGRQDGNKKPSKKQKKQG